MKCINHSPARCTWITVACPSFGGTSFFGCHITALSWSLSQHSDGFPGFISAFVFFCSLTIGDFHCFFNTFSLLFYHQKLTHSFSSHFYKDDAMLLIECLSLSPELQSAFLSPAKHVHFAFSEWDLNACFATPVFILTFFFLSTMWSPYHIYSLCRQNTWVVFSPSFPIFCHPRPHVLSNVL